MDFNFKRKSTLRIFYTCLLGMLFLISPITYAEIIAPNTVINVPTTYSNVTLDLTNGSFIVKNNAKLTIENCNIIGTLSAANPTLITVENGSLSLTNNVGTITAGGIVPHPFSQSLLYVVRLIQAKIDMTGNRFIIDKSYSAGFLISSTTIPANDLIFVNNRFENFHGVLYLLNTTNSLVDGNVFTVNSYGNILLVGTNSVVTRNKINFSGRDQIGNAIDIFDSEGITVSDNVIFTSGCGSIFILSSQNITVDANSIAGGITHAIRIFSSFPPMSKDKDNYAAKILSNLGRKTLKHANSQHIKITSNILSQNRYGINARDVDDLTVTGNYFSQRFDTAKARKFWTDNDVLLTNVTNLVWLNNVYKEAYTQINGGDNSNTVFVTFPASGGVTL